MSSKYQENLFSQNTFLLFTVKGMYLQNRGRGMVREW
jgi:hypothetical protein